MSYEKQKLSVAQKAVSILENKLDENTILGIGSGSTVNYFIKEIAKFKQNFRACVAASDASAKLLQENGIEVLSLNFAGELDFYVDGADEINTNFQMIKGGGAALTREKIIASASAEFICIADASKKVDVLGQFPLPIEVIPEARSYVARELVKLGASPVWRDGVTTDNGNIILDCFNFKILDPIAIEQKLNQIAGVVTNGIFALRPADKLLISNKNGEVEIFQH